MNQTFRRTLALVNTQYTFFSFKRLSCKWHGLPLSPQGGYVTFLAQIVSRSQSTPSPFKETLLRSGYNLLYRTLPGQRSKIKYEEEEKQKTNKKGGTGPAGVSTLSWHQRAITCFLCSPLPLVSSWKRWVKTYFGDVCKKPQYHQKYIY